VVFDLFGCPGEPRCGLGNTDTSTGRLMLAVLGGLADVERDLIRTGEGRERAKAIGLKMGHPPKLTPHQQSDLTAAATDRAGWPVVA
jgi:DNA invertase Pin-like site-specific DNA recombinase